MIYESIIGSRAYGLELDTSDTDILRVLSEPKNYREGKRDVHAIRYDEFIRQCIGPSIIVYDLCTLFPKEFLLNNNLSGWILENREQIVVERKPVIYQGFMDAVEGLAYDGAAYYAEWPDRLACSTHFANVLYNYANGMTFAEAHVASNDTKDFLLSVRKGEPELSLVLEENALALERAKSVETFYTSGIVTTSIFDEFKSVVQAEIDALGSTT